MDFQRKSNKPEMVLIHHSLIACNAETKIKQAPGVGGNVDFNYEITTPVVVDNLIKQGTYTCVIQITAAGKIKDSEDIAFNASCKMEGVYQVLNYPCDGADKDDHNRLLSLSIQQLNPLTVQYLSEMISRMGYKNITVPPFFVGELLPVNNEEPPPVKTIKNKKK